MRQATLQGSSSREAELWGIPTRLRCTSSSSLSLLPQLPALCSEQSPSSFLALAERRWGGLSVYR